MRCHQCQPLWKLCGDQKLTGAQIKEMLETSLTIQKNCIAANDSGEWDAWPNDSGSYLQVGGITVRFDPAQPAGARVLSVQKMGRIWMIQKSIP